MAWNRPSNGGRANTPGSPRRGRSPRPTVAVRGVIAGAVVVLGAAVAAWWIWLSGESAGETPPPQTRGLIKEVAPAVTNRVSHKRTTGPKVDEKGMPVEVGQLVNGYVRLPSGRLHKVHGVTTSHVARITLADRIFKHHSDRQMSRFLTAVPGNGMVLGESKYLFKNFEKEFRESLKDPVVITADDGPEEVALKEGIIEMRAEMKARMDAGEDVAQIMRDTRDQYKELGTYRQELIKEVDKVLNERKDLTANDLDDLVKAANQMLTDRGASALKLDQIFKYRIKSYLRKAKKEK